MATESSFETSLKGFLYLIIPIIGLFFEATRKPALIFLGIMTVLFVLALLWASWSARRDDAKHGASLKSAEKKISGLVKNHLKALADRRDTLVRVDHYGIVDGADWNKELQHFVDKVIRPVLTDEEAQAVARAGLSQVSQRLIEEPVARHCERRPSPARVPEDMSALDFEGLCAAVLRRNGWNASTTKGSGDQGADVIADKGGIKLILQCKLHSKAVGNKAVQEALAAKHFYGAQHAAVVCKTSYTKSAKVLAQTANVDIMVYPELEDYIQRLSEVRKVR